MTAQMRIEPLEHKHRYRFRVRAVNKIGRSDPCEMLGDDILIKDPWGECHLVSVLHCSTHYHCSLNTIFPSNKHPPCLSNQINTSR